jgi:hypothetical protein
MAMSVRVIGADNRRDGREFAIKKFKPDKEGEAVAHYSGISQSAVREMAVFPIPHGRGLMVVMSRGGSYQCHSIGGGDIR